MSLSDPNGAKLHVLVRAYDSGFGAASRRPNVFGGLQTARTIYLNSRLPPIWVTSSAEVLEPIGPCLDLDINLPRNQVRFRQQFWFRGEVHFASSRAGPCLFRRIFLAANSISGDKSFDGFSVVSDGFGGRGYQKKRLSVHLITLMSNFEFAQRKEF